VGTLIAPRPGNHDANALAVGDDKLYVESHTNFPQRGYLLVSDGTNQEVIGYTGKGYDEETVGGKLVKRPFFEGVRWLRRRFATPLVNLDFRVYDNEAAGELSSDFMQKGVVRLFEARYDDRLPVDPDPANNESDGTPQFRSDTRPINLDGNPPYLEITRTIRGARWDSIKWVEGPDDLDKDPNERAPTWDMTADKVKERREKFGTEIFILARVSDRPDGKLPPPWSQMPVAWDSDDAKGGEPGIIRFDLPCEDNTLGIEGDTIELRIYFRYNANYVYGDDDDDHVQGEVKSWTSPMLRGLRIGYTAPSSIYQQEEVRF